MPEQTSPAASGRHMLEQMGIPGEQLPMEDTLKQRSVRGKE